MIDPTKLDITELYDLRDYYLTLNQHHMLTDHERLDFKSIEKELYRKQLEQDRDAL